MLRFSMKNLKSTKMKNWHMNYLQQQNSQLKYVMSLVTISQQI